MDQFAPPTAAEIEATLGLTPQHRRNRWLKRGLAIFLVLGIPAGIWYAYALLGSSDGVVDYETVPISRGDLVVTISATGTIQPLTQVDIGSELSGVVREVLVDANSRVKVGDTLATLDTSRLDGQLAKAAAQLGSAQAKMTDAKVTFEERQLSRNRLATLRARGVSTDQEMQAADAAVARADAALAATRADITAIEADLTIIETDIAKTRITSPIDGVVLKREVEPGQTVASSLQAPVLFQIAKDLSRMQLEAAVDEADIGVVKQGQQAMFTVDAYRGRRFPAVIESLSFAPETIDGVVTYKAILSAANTDLALRPGMTATARITVEEFKQALMVPNEALRYQPPREETSSGFSITQLFMPRFPRNNKAKRDAAVDGTRPIYILRDTKIVTVKIKTGASDGVATLILNGDVKPDDAAIIAQKAGQQ